MTREQAHSLLNAAQAGHPVSEFRITEALIATGDFTPKKEEKEVVFSYSSYLDEKVPA
jgi:hypothetical protein